MGKGIKGLLIILLLCVIGCESKEAALPKPSYVYHCEFLVDIPGTHKADCIEAENWGWGNIRDINNIMARTYEAPLFLDWECTDRGLTVKMCEREKL